MSNVKVVVFAACLSMLGACAMPSRVDEMAVENGGLAFSEGYIDNMRIEVVSSNSTRYAAWTPEVTKASFEAALVKSLQAEKLYSEGGDYRLIADVLDITEPMAGANMRVDMTVRYTLTPSNSRGSLLTETIRSEHTATISDQLLGEARLREAAEQAARENISRLLEKLAI